MAQQRSSLGLLVCGESDWAPRRSFRDPAMVADERVLENLLAAEEHRHAPSTSYFLFQEDIQPYMRKVVAKWMLEVCEEQCREEQVFPLAVNYLDRVLSSIQIKRTQLQLIAAACMFISSKVKETNPLEPEKLVIYTDFSITLNDLLVPPVLAEDTHGAIQETQNADVILKECEMLVLQVLKWDTSAVLAHDFLELLIVRLPVDEKDQSSVLRHAQTFVTMCATEFSFSVHPPSVIAVSSLTAAIFGLNGPQRHQRSHLLSTLQQLTSIDAECIEACREQIEQLLHQHVTRDDLQTTFDTPSSSSAPLPPTTAQNQTKCDSTSLSSTPTDIRDIHLCQ